MKPGHFQQHDSICCRLLSCLRLYGDVTLEDAMDKRRHGAIFLPGHLPQLFQFSIGDKGHHAMATHESRGKSWAAGPRSVSILASFLSHFSLPAGQQNPDMNE